MGRDLTEHILEKIDNYIKGLLTGNQYTDFEKELENDNQLREEVLLQQQLFTIIGREKWSSLGTSKKIKELQKLKQQLRSEEYQTISKNIRAIGNEYVLNSSTHKNSKKRYYHYITLSAVAAALLIGIFIFNTNNSLPSLYSKNVHWEESLPSFIEKSSEKNNFTSGEIFFRTKKYKEAIKLFQNVSIKEDLYPYSLMYIGASYELLDENDKALQTFDSLIHLTGFQENSKGYWYQLLIYLKLNNKKKVLETLLIITKNENNYHYTEAQELLQEIDN